MKIKIVRASLVLGLALVFSGLAQGSTIQITFKNAAGRDGVWIMRPWIGLHDGHFQTFTLGQSAPSGIQHIAEDGVSGDVSNTSLLSGPPNVCAGDPAVYNDENPCENQIFSNYAGGSQQITIGGPTSPGATLLATLTVNPLDPNSQYLSFIVMIVPSNDAFFGTNSEHPIQLFDRQGRFNHGNGPIRIKLGRRDILDAGTEVNTESATDTAFFGQMVNGTGTHPDTNPVVHQHPGFGPTIVTGSNIYPASQINLFDNMNQAGEIAEVTITEIP